jgi:bifunctional non-homologous end joining protein LigD
MTRGRSGDLEEYRRRRDFERTPEPRGSKRSNRTKALCFVVQKHAARALHYDFRLELDGVLKSWAVPKGPSLSPGARRMAVEVEDHPLEYGRFEGTIPAGEYGGGAVLLWDRGHWEPIGDPRASLAKGELAFRLSGEKLRGRWHLVRMRARGGKRTKPAWLLIKGNDEAARRGPDSEITSRAPESVVSGRAIEEVARSAKRGKAAARTREARPAPDARVEPSALAGAKRAALPRAVEPQLATLVAEAPAGDEWVHEVKFDGYRVLCRVEGGRVRIATRAGHDWTDRFPGLARALEKLPAERALLDGEAAVLDTEGRSHFQRLQNALGREEPDLQLFLFDLLHLDGWDLRAAPLAERKRLLRQLLARLPARAPLRYSGELRGRGPAVLAEACKSGLEGIVSKRADAPYRSGRSRSWLKAKCQKRQEFVVVGWTEPAGSRTGFGALLLGAHDAKGALRYCGKVGTGFSRETLTRLRGKLTALARRTAPVVDPGRAGRGAHWIAPRLVAEVSFTEWTRDGKVRHPAFLGLREDKSAAEVHVENEQPLEASAGAAPRQRSEVAGVRLSHPDRVYWPDLGVTKSELAQYYETVAERLLPGLVERPLSLVRCPEGIGGARFYQKHAGSGVPERVPRVVVARGESPYAMVTDLPSVVSLVQIGVLELHVWGARADRLDRPDLLVFDLDPAPDVPWRNLADTARVLRALLEDLELVPFLRGTGGKGLHVVVPLRRGASWEDVKRFAHSLALRMEREAPQRFTTQAAKSRRKGRIFLDYLRNAREATAIASYSTRAQPGAPVAMPLFWEEIEGGKGPPRFNLREAPARLAREDPWRRFEASRRPLGRDALRRAAG